MLGFTIALIVNFTVGLVGFWTLETGGAFLIYRMLAQFSSGALIPLWFMPAWLQDSLTLLPFSAQVFVPLSIYVDQDPGWHTVRALGLQAMWVAVLVALATLVWHRAIRRLVNLRWLTLPPPRPPRRGARGRAPSPGPSRPGAPTRSCSGRPGGACACTG